MLDNLATDPAGRADLRGLPAAAVEVLLPLEASMMTAAIALYVSRYFDPPHGHCYVASEVLQEILGPDHWKPEQVVHEGMSHWYLRHRRTGEVLDITAGQFLGPVDYSRGVGRGFLTREPSRRARAVLSVMGGGCGA